MLESSPGYQYFLSQGKAEGKAEGEARGLLRLVEHRLGRRPAGLEERLANLELEQLRDLFDSVLTAEDADALERLLSDVLQG